MNALRHFDRREPVFGRVEILSLSVKAALDESMAGKPVTTASTRPYGCSVKYKLF